MCQFEVVVFTVEKAEDNLLESVGARTLALRKGGCFGEGIHVSLPLAVNIRTTSDMDGRNAAEVCVHRSPI